MVAGLLTDCCAADAVMKCIKINHIQLCKLWWGNYVTKHDCTKWTVANAQGSSIYSETAAANYENAGVKGVFESQIPNIPAKRLGTTEEVYCTFFIFHRCLCDLEDILYLFITTPLSAFIVSDWCKVYMRFVISARSGWLCCIEVYTRTVL